MKAAKDKDWGDNVDALENTMLNSTLLSDPVDELKDALETAIDAEHYTLAAQIRDELKRRNQ